MEHPQGERTLYARDLIVVQLHRVHLAGTKLVVLRVGAEHARQQDVSARSQRVFCWWWLIRRDDWRVSCDHEQVFRVWVQQRGRPQSRPRQQGPHYPERSASSRRSVASHPPLRDMTSHTTLRQSSSPGGLGVGFQWPSSPTPLRAPQALGIGVRIDPYASPDRYLRSI